MKTIKFRGKDKDGCWVYGLPLRVHGTGDWCIAKSNEWMPTFDNPDEGEDTVFIKIDTDTLCQFTGFVDKNGVDVYDRDLLKSDEFSANGEYDIFEIYYYESTGAYMIENIYPEQTGSVSYAGGWRINEMFEVCGNTIDNKEYNLE